MRVKLNHFAPLLAATATVVAIIFAPVAAAAPSQHATGAGNASTPSESTDSQQSCASLGGTQNLCQSRSCEPPQSRRPTSKPIIESSC